MRMLWAAIVPLMLAAPLPLAAQQQEQQQQQQQQQQPNGGNAAAEDEPKIDVTRNGDWEVACQEVEENGNKAKACEMRQILVEKQSNKEWVRIAVSYAPGSNQPVLRIFTPLGVLLQPGLTLQVDDSEPQRLQYAVCLARPPRCLVAGPMDTEMVAMLKKGLKGTLTISLPNNQTVNAPFSLKGFTASLNSLPQG